MGADDGTGVIGSLTGVAIFLTLLFVAVHVLLHLYATSVVTAVAFDAARVVSGRASEDQRAAAAADAEANAAGLLGSYAADTSFTWRSLGPETVELHVSANRPNVLPDDLTGLFGLDTIERTIRVRVEDFQ